MRAQRAILVVLLLASPLAASQPQSEPVRFALGVAPGLDAASLDVGDARVVRLVPEIGLMLVESDAEFGVRAQFDPRFLYVEADAPRDLLFQIILPPNDPQYGNQYALPQTNAPAAWSVTTGSTDAAVCVVDTGVRYTHQDLAGPRWKGGIDIANADADPMDDEGHGTHVAGIAAAGVNNALNIAGVGNVALYAAKVLDENGEGTFADVATGIVWCADRADARVVINLSLGCGGGSLGTLHGSGEACDSQPVRDAIAYAQAQGRLVVAASGNSGPCYSCVSFPARLPDVVAVGCTGDSENVCIFTSVGPQLALAAPGIGILSLSSASDTATTYLDGTSMSSPLVAGAAALFWSHNPTLTAAQVRARLIASAQDIWDPGHDVYSGCGELDLGRLFSNTGSCVRPPIPPCDNVPVNDCFANATQLLDHNDDFAVSNFGATLDDGEPSPCDAGATVWYKYTPVVTGTAFFEIDATLTNPAHYPTIAGYQLNADGSLAYLGCTDNLFEYGWLDMPCVAGTTYYLQIGGWYGDQGAFPFYLNTCRLAFTPPSVPRSFAAAGGPGEGEIRLSWQAPSDDGGATRTGYRLLRSVGCTASYEDLAFPAASATSYQDGGYSPTQRVCYLLHALNANGESAPASVAGTALGFPSEPTKVKATASPGKIRVTWDAPNTTGGGAFVAYRVYAAETADGIYGPVGSAGATRAFEHALPANETRYYKVAMETSFGEGPQGGPSGAKTPTAPGAPRGVVAEPDTMPGRMRVSWQAPESDGGDSIDYYKVYSSPSQTGSYTFRQNVYGTRVWIDPSAPLIGERWYTVRAMNGVDLGPASAPACGGPIYYPLAC